MLADVKNSMPYVFMALDLQYPKEPPRIYAAESKGLDENRQAYLISTIQNTAKEFSNYPMLVTLCEVWLFLSLSLQ
jgi:hypothetical protein